VVIAVTVCRGCEAWQVEYDTDALAAQELTFGLENEYGFHAPGVALRRAAGLVETVLWEHLVDCPPGRAWLDRQLRRMRVERGQGPDLQRLAARAGRR
jgi:hypothetical protein